MAWLNYPLRRAMVAAALLVLFVVDVSVVALAATTDFTAVEQANTLAFLRGIAAVNPSLAAIWTGTDFCAWLYMSCSTYSGGTFDLNTYGSPAFTGSLVLPELSDDVDGSAVIFVDIRTNGLGSRMTGTLPASWGRLTRLYTLHLNDNALTGTIPAAWSGLTAMKEVYLQNNTLTGSLPATWGTLKLLSTVQLNNNTLTGSLPAEWSGLTAVAALHLNDNRISGSLPSSWSGMKALYTLHLDNNAIDGSLPAEWSALTTLYELNISGNMLSGTLPGSWKGISSLRNVYLNRNALSGPLPAEWKDIRYLTDLELSDNAMSGTLPAEWSAMRYISKLYLARNQFAGTIPSAWTVLSDLTVDLQSNNLCGCIPESWKTNSYSHTVMADAALYAADCSVSNACPATTTTTTTTTETPLTPEQTATLGFLRSFTAMDASLLKQWTGTNYCSWVYVRCVGGGAVQLDLTGLVLSGTALVVELAADVTVGAVAGAASLPELAADVDGSAVAVTVVNVAGKGAALAGTLPASWGGLTRLETLNVAHNGIRGTLPAAWSNMSALRSLDVSGNALSGGVPASWGTMRELASVAMTGTGLCGCLPAQWASKTVAADAALLGSDCATANACPAETSTSVAPAHKSGPNLLPLWCVLGALGGLLVGVALGLSVFFYRRRQHRAEEAKRLRASEEREMEPFMRSLQSPY